MDSCPDCKVETKLVSYDWQLSLENRWCPRCGNLFKIWNEEKVDVFVPELSQGDWK